MKSSGIDGELTSSSETAKDLKTTSPSKSSISNQTHTSNNDSPSSANSSPTKSKSKRRNEARKRRLQQQQQLQQQQSAVNNESTNNENQTLPQQAEQDDVKANGNMALQHDELDEQSQSSESHADPSPNNNVHNNHSDTKPSVSKVVPNVDDKVKDRLELSNEEKVNKPIPDQGQQVNNNNHEELLNRIEDLKAAADAASKEAESAKKLRSADEKAFKNKLAQQNSQIKTLADQLKQQNMRIKELEMLLLNATRTCNRLEKSVEQELEYRAKLECENTSSCQTINRLKNQIATLEKNKMEGDSLLRIVEATLMERDTELSMLKLHLSRLLLKVDNDGSLRASLAEELKPSKRPDVLERRMKEISSRSKFVKSDDFAANLSPGQFVRNRNYKTLPRSMRSPDQEFFTTKLSTTGTTNISTSKTSKNNNNNSVVVEAENSTNGLPLVNNFVQSNQNKQNSHINTGNINKLDQSTPSSNEPSNQNGGVVNISETRKGSKETENIQSCSNKQRPSLTTGLDDNQKQQHLSHDDQQPRSLSTATTSRLASMSGEGKPSVFEQAPCKSTPATPMKGVESSTSTPVKPSSAFMRLLDKFRRGESLSGTPTKESAASNGGANTLKSGNKLRSPFRRNNTSRSTMVGLPNEISSSSMMSPVGSGTNKSSVSSFQTDKPFAEWDTDMLVEWLNSIGLNMYASQCRKWVKCGAHIMNATPAEVDKGLAITNHLHRKKLRLAISDVNGDCDKITKASAKLDYLWVARWLDDIGLPQYKEAFVNARVDGRVLNYLTIEDLVSLGVKGLLHHASIRCGIKVLRSINFNLQMLKRRATPDEIEQMNSMRHQMDMDVGQSSVPVVGNNNHISSTSNDNDAHQHQTLKQALAAAAGSSTSTKVSDSMDAKGITLWSCHRLMEWLRLIDFAEFAPNLRGSGVHGGLLVMEDAFNINTMCALLSIPPNRTLLRRHLATYFDSLIGPELSEKKRLYLESSSNPQLNPLDEIKTPKRSPLWFGRLKTPKVSNMDTMDDYLCPMYPVEPQINLAAATTVKKASPPPSESQVSAGHSHLAKIPESINV